MPVEQTAILVVDDDPLIRSICKKVVESHGFAPILAENGQEALNIFRENHEGIALVVSDVSMPVMNGIDMAQQMFAIKPHSNLILMTGYTAQLVFGELKDLCAMLYKPFTPRQLIEAIHKCLKYQEARGGPGGSVAASG
jgi:DNA-binding NtrC family response regulator